MSRKTKTLLSVVGAILAVGITAAYLRGVNIPVLEPAGPVGRSEKHLIIIAAVLSLIVVAPVFALTIFIVYKYRASNQAAPYRPDWDGNRAIELTWWAIPGVIITILSVVAWNSAHALDPFKALSSSVKPVEVQVVSLDWKWLFIYPKQGIASVNRLEVPTGTPINFSITSDTVMNSFWVPALGGQIYAMPGMNTQLHLQADKAGSYRGLSANISGAGFSKMDFTATAVAPSKFSAWSNDTKKSGQRLDKAAYASLANPSNPGAEIHYSTVQSGLYSSIIDKYMAPVIHPQLQAAGAFNE